MMVTEAVKLITGVGETLWAGCWSSMRFPRAGVSCAYPRTGIGSHHRTCRLRNLLPAPRDGRRGCRERPVISVDELAARLAKREAGEDDFVLVDVREPVEFEIARIPGSVLVPAEASRTDVAGADSSGRSADPALQGGCTFRAGVGSPCRAGYGGVWTSKAGSTPGSSGFPGRGPGSSFPGFWALLGRTFDDRRGPQTGLRGPFPKFRGNIPLPVPLAHNTLMGNSGRVDGRFLGEKQ